MKLGFLSEKSNDYFSLVRLATKENIENGNYEDLDDLNKILEQFKGFVVNSIKIKATLFFEEWFFICTV